MNDYISREEVLETLRKANIGGYITDRLLEIPSADVQPVKRGRWEYKEDKYGNDYICSNCKNKNDERTWFCPYCGVDMREDCYEHRKS